MDTFNREFRLFDENFAWTAKELLSKIIDAHDLHDWANDKGIEYEGAENYINNVYEYAQINRTGIGTESEFMKLDEKTGEVINCKFEDLN